MKMKLRAIIQAVKARPCTDCNIQYPYYVMQFDHLRDKVRNVKNFENYGSERKLREEIAKCDLVCANCHSERTFQRLRS